MSGVKELPDEPGRDGAEVASGLSRRRLLATAGSGAIAGIAATLARNDVAEAATREGEVGVASQGGTAMEFTSKVDQVADQITAYGYLTKIHGLDQSVLFVDPDNPSEGTARFTFFGKATLQQRTTLSDDTLFIIDAGGHTNYYLNSAAGADFSDPDSFKAGKRIARDAVQFQDVLNVTSPNVGIPNVTGSITREDVDHFNAGGARHTLGHVGMNGRFSASGKGAKLGPEPTAVLFLGASLVITDQA